MDVSYSPAYYDAGQVLVAAEGSSLTGIRDLAGRRVAVEAGSVPPGVAVEAASVAPGVAVPGCCSSFSPPVQDAPTAAPNVSASSKASTFIRLVTPDILPELGLRCARQSLCQRSPSVNSWAT